MIIIDGTTQPTDFTRTGGRLWIPSSDHIAGEGNATFSDALVCCPLGKYIFVKPQGAYLASQFIALRDVTEGYDTYAQITGYIFWLGDSSSCGGTVIAHNTSDPMQKFLRDPAVATEFHSASITRGGFFLLGDRQGAGVAAGEIKKIVYDGQLDFLVLAAHQLPGEDPELPVVALRHLIASIRWDYGFRLPILLMMGDDSPNHHLIKESARDSFNSNEWDAAPGDDSPPGLSDFPGTPLLLGDITDQADIAADGTAFAQNAAEVAVLDRTGDLGLNWWPVMAFVPNSDGGKAVETTLMGMGGDVQPNKAFYHPLLIPTTDSGCPFNTNRALSAVELARAETLFESTLLLSHSPASDVTNRTTSIWFWDFAAVKNITSVRAWTIPSGRLDATEDNLSYVSDTSVAWESTPRWVTHPLIGREFAIEFYLAARSANTAVRWFGKHFPQDKFGNLPLLLGAGDVEDGWITSVVPFLLSPTASAFQAYVSVIPNIPPWVKFSWVVPDDLSFYEAVDLADFFNEATDYMSVRVAGGQPRDVDIGECEGGDNTAKRWTFGINQQSVVLYGKVCDGLAEALGESASLDLRVAPFAVHPQVRNLKMGQTMPNGKKTSIVWPSRLFYISPIFLPIEWAEFGPTAAFNVPLGFWSSQGFQFGSAMGTPLLIDAMQRDNAYINAGILPTTVDIVMEAPTDKGDFPPMMDTTQNDDPNGPGRMLANHFARIDIAPNRVSRVAEGGRGGVGGGGIPKACENLDALAWRWPLRDDKKLVISADGGFTATRPYGMHCGIDLVYEDGSQQGADILAAADGTILSNRYCPQCGNYIEIAHMLPPFPSTTRVISRYLHMDNPSDRQVGEEVRRGDVIGKVGSLGVGSTGAHLHFAVYCNTVGECASTGIDPCALPWGEPANGVCSFDDTGVCTDGCGDTNVENLIVWMFDAAIDAAGDSQYISTPIGQKLRTDVAKAIARAESGVRCNPPDNENSPRNCLAAGPNCTNFESPPNCVNNDRGLFQINLCAHSNQLRGLGIINSAHDLYNCRVNIQAAIIISRNGADWTAWSTWTAGTYLRYLN